MNAEKGRLKKWLVFGGFWEEEIGEQRNAVNSPECWSRKSDMEAKAIKHVQTAESREGAN